MSTTTSRPSLPMHAAGSLPVMAWLGAALARQASRRALAALDARLLADVGLSREQALREAAKPLWAG